MRARLLELVLFAALAALALWQWGRLAADSTAPLLVAFAVLVAGSGALAALGAVRARRGVVWTAAAGLGVAMVAGGLLAVGTPGRLLAPGNWPELVDGLSLGLAGIEDTELPYAGGDAWLRRTLLFGGPLLLALGATLAFWPARRRQVLRVYGLAAAVAVYAIAVTLDSPRHELLLGALLLMLAVAWLWALRLPRRRALAALGVAAAAALAAIPASAALATDEPWWNYESWDWFQREREVSFNWNHSYGPLEWPDEGTTLLGARSDRPLYWKASVLDRFDGLSWERAEPGDPLAEAELLARLAAPGSELAQRRAEWVEQATIEVDALSSEVVVAPGSTLALRGLTGVDASQDGTLALSGEPLQAGDEYSVLGYSPNPTPRELRASPASYPERRFDGQVLLAIPQDGAPTAAQPMPLWGERDPAVEARIEASPYAGAYGLARRLTAGADHPYEAALEIERHLREGYDYSTNVPESTYSLAAFLEDDRSGYCQQFAGSMALMLRMIGIPSRVVSGFAPGDLDAERDLYEVRDTDAHAWVEVYFRGIGWVIFDPTPAAAPAASRTAASEVDPATAATAGDDAAAAELERGRRILPEIGAGDGAAGGGGEGPGPVAIGALALTGAGAGAGVFAWSRRRRRLAAGGESAAQATELVAALRRLGWRVEPDVTLMQLERRFAGAGREAISSYAGALRAHRYAPRAAPPPGPRARRALRRALAAGGGPRRRLRALLAVPPGGPGR